MKQLQSRAHEKQNIRPADVLCLTLFDAMVDVVNGMVDQINSILGCSKMSYA